MNRLRPFLPFALFALALVAMQFILRASGREYCLTQLTMSLYYAIVVIGLCLVMGYAGQVSLGHGAFFAIGGYTSAVLTTHDFSRFKSAAWAGALRQLHGLLLQGLLRGLPRGRQQGMRKKKNCASCSLSAVRIRWRASHENNIK